MKINLDAEIFHGMSPSFDRAIITVGALVTCAVAYKIFKCYRNWCTRENRTDFVIVAGRSSYGADQGASFIFRDRFQSSAEPIADTFERKEGYDL